MCLTCSKYQLILSILKTLRLIALSFSLSRKFGLVSDNGKINPYVNRDKRLMGNTVMYGKYQDALELWIIDFLLSAISIFFLLIWLVDFYYMFKYKPDTGFISILLFESQNRLVFNKSMDFGPSQPGIESHLCHLLAVWSWKNYSIP